MHYIENKNQEIKRGLFYKFNNNNHNILTFQDSGSLLRVWTDIILFMFVDLLGMRFLNEIVHMDLFRNGGLVINICQTFQNLCVHMSHIFL